MSDRLEIELDKLKLPIFIVEDGKYLIKKLDQNSFNNLTMEKGKSYVVRILDTEVSIDLMKLTDDNWNNSRHISSGYLKCQVSQIIGDMIQLNGVGYDPTSDKDLSDVYLNYWVNRNCIQLVDVLD